MADFARKVLAAKHDPRNVIGGPSATYYGYVIDDNSQPRQQQSPHRTNPP